MKTPKASLLLIALFAISYFLSNSQSWAGGGYYFGADYVKNSIRINTLTSVSGVIPDLTTYSRDEQKINSNDYGFRAGYKHKLNKYTYISPEFFYQQLDKSSYLYSTTMKAGLEIKDFSIFGSLGYAEIDKFNNSAANFGGGIEYKINDNFSIGAEYIKFGDVNTLDQEFGLININTDKTNKLQSIKFGITYYFHE
jgi:opacity protein-like surface antigen